MTEQNIFDNKGITTNSEQIAILKKHFPNCFDKEGNFLIDSFKEILKSDDINTSHEGYTLDWLGKSYARLLANERPRTLIRPDKEHNAKELNKNSNNLLIKGDNLEVLKHLKNAYTESVKVIYIDPPYNTKKGEFVYKDDRKFTKEELSNLANVSEEDAQRILDFTDKGSNSHSAWLTFIYPRLYVARELLREDGVIFISIDDNEQAQLKLLCDEVFGTENFVGMLVIQTATDNNPTQISIEHEYMLCYANKKEILSSWSARSEAAEKIQEQYLSLKSKYQNDILKIQEELRNWIKKNKTILPKVTHYDNVDSRGVFHDGDIANTKFGGYDYSIIHPITKRICKVPEKGFRFPEETLKKMILDDDIVFGVDETTLMKPKKRLTDAKDILRTIIYEDGRTSSNIVDSLVGRGVFNNPKSHFILKRILDFVTNPTSQDIVLDFFAGSGTTAHSVMMLNEIDKGNRQYIMVQLPEETDKKSEAYKVNYKTIFDITKARIEKAAEKMQAENPDYNGDLGFKIFETTPLPQYYDEEIDELSSDMQTKIWDGSEADENELEAILTTWSLYDRILLTTDLEPVILGDYKAYYGKGKESNTLYLMNKGFNIDHIKLIIDKLENDKEFTPKKIVLYGHNFETKPQRELSEALNSFRNKKQLEIDIIKRY